jgi:hypothetical protein
MPAGSAGSPARPGPRQTPARSRPDRSTRSRHLCHHLRWSTGHQHGAVGAGAEAASRSASLALDTDADATEILRFALGRVLRDPAAAEAIRAELDEA